VKKSEERWNYFAVKGGTVEVTYSQRAVALTFQSTPIKGARPAVSVLVFDHGDAARISAALRRASVNGRKMR
jgi:hypothetical protein